MAYGVILGQNQLAQVNDLQNQVQQINEQIASLESQTLPIGTIVIWSGSTSNIPTNWHLCDGTNGTPDLRGQFVIGAGGSYSVGNTGGESEHTLTVNEMPSHSHNLSLSGLTTSSAGAHTHNISYGTSSTAFQSLGSAGLATYRTTTNSDGEHTHTIQGSGSIGSTGGGSSHNNLPPYYALCYIMKIA